MVKAAVACVHHHTSLVRLVVKAAVAAFIIVSLMCDSWLRPLWLAFIIVVRKSGVACQRSSHTYDS